MLGPIKTGQLSPATDRLSLDMAEDAPMQLLTGNAEDYGFCEPFVSKGRQSKLEYANSLECTRNMVEDEIRESYPLWNAKGNLLQLIQDEIWAQRACIHARLVSSDAQPGLLPCLAILLVDKVAQANICSLHLLSR